MAAEIKDKLDINVELISGSGGIFDVIVDGQLAYSKQANGNQFPQSDVLIKQLQQPEE